MVTSPDSAQPNGDAEQAIRDAIAEAVLGSSPTLRQSLETDPDAYLRLVALSRTAADESNRLLRDSVGGARTAGHSWDTLGRILGVSRQAAQQRFGSITAASDTSAGPSPQRRVLSPLTAFDEMAVLAREGIRGWHSIDYGTLFHRVEASPFQWEHRRVAWSPIGGHRRLEADGWIRIREVTFPWAYYKRQLNSPAVRDA